MILKSISLKNFMGFKDFTTAFNKITFIKGKNGSGKSTLVQIAPSFALYGIPAKDKKLMDLPAKKTEGVAIVDIVIEQNQNVYNIHREYPSKLSIKKNGLLVNYSNITDCNNYIKNLFYDINYFRKFRMVDNENGIDVLSEGNNSLKKTIFSHHEIVMNLLKTNIDNIIKERNRYNIDNIKGISIYPSQQRLNLLVRSFNNIEKQQRELESKRKQIVGKQSSLLSEYKYLEKNIAQTKQNIDRLSKNQSCYICNRPIDQKNHDRLSNMEQNKLNDFLLTFNSLIDPIRKYDDELALIDNDANKIQNKINKIQELIFKLKNRIANKEYIYTNRDVLIAKKAKEYINKFSSEYLFGQLSSLKPIINSILTKINYKLDFNLCDNGELNILLIKDDIIYQRSDLSTGQKLLLQIAFKIALLLQRGETGLIIADEGMSSLDIENLLHVIDIIQQYPFQLIFVLHNIDLNLLPDYVKIIEL